MSTTEAAPVTEDVPMASTEESKEVPQPTEDAPTDEKAPIAEEAAAPASEKPKSHKKASGPAKKVARGGPTSSNGAKKEPAAEGSKTFEADQIVLARLKGYPPWPARVVDPESVSSAVSSQKPLKSTSHVCVQYFPKGDHSWLPSRELKHLLPHEITAWLKEGHRKAGKKGTGGLKEAYETAQDPTAWIANLPSATAEDEEEQDELEDDGEEVGGGKRKRAEKKDKKKVAKASKKAKKSAEAVESEEEAQPTKPKSKSAKPAAKKEKVEAKSAAPENQASAEEDPLANDPEAVKVKDWRHKLQRAFLGKGLPSAEEMGTYDELFKTIESYEKMTVDYLSHSKIGKVMKKIATLTAIPKNDELKITDRASSLMNKWAELVGNKEEPKEANGNGNGTTNGDKPTSKAE